MTVDDTGLVKSASKFATLPRAVGLDQHHTCVRPLRDCGQQRLVVVGQSEDGNDFCSAKTRDFGDCRDL